MANLKDIRRRIGSVKSTQKITRAMKLVSAAKFARANAAVVAARPYGKAFDDMVARLIAAAGDDVDSPFLTEKPEKKALVVVLATDRGFCGGMNSNLFKATLNFVAEKRKSGVEVDFVTWGKRARMFQEKMKYKSVASREKVLEKPNYLVARELSEELGKHYQEQGYDRVYVAFVEFQSAMSQAPKVKQVLPVQRAKAEAVDQNLIIEPSVKELLPGLLKRQLASVIFRALLEGSASEHGARMTAMDSATNNANEVLREMKIEYNRARQAAITKELIEITSGAQAL